MQSKSQEATSRSFDPMSIPGLSGKMQEAVKATFDAMSAWRNEVANNSEKGTKQVIEKMAAAAAALGWPEQVVDAARMQMQSITDMQIKTMDHLMDAWEEQLKSPNPMRAWPSAMLSKLQSSPGFGASGSSSSGDPMNPLQFWMQSAEQWQKSWADMMKPWSGRGT
jgi:ribonuclease D